MKHTFGSGKLKRKYLTAADAWLIFSVLAIAVILTFAFLITGLHRRMTVAVIEQDGRELMRLSLEEEQKVSIPWGSGYNVIVVNSQEIFVSEADCPDQICVRQGKISGSGESIVCLPHRLVIRLEGAESGEPDAITD